MSLLLNAKDADQRFAQPFIITIDGPSASGKGTIAFLLAQKLNFHYLDSGAMYRTMAHLAIEYQTDDIAILIDAFHASNHVFSHDAILLNQQDITHQLRTELVAKKASQLAGIPAIRQALLKKQRDFAELPGLVADGRDMGTVIFPKAELKIFLVAQVGIRAERRYKQLLRTQKNVHVDVITRELIARDMHDQYRAIAPLKPAPDAHIIDSSYKSIDEILEELLQLWEDVQN